MEEKEERQGTGGSPEEFFRNISRSTSSKKVAYELLQPGKTLEYSLTKSHLRSPKQLNQVVQFLAKLEMYGLGMEATPPLNTWAIMIKRWLDASVAIDGEARAQAMQTDIGVAMQTLAEYFASGKITSDSKPKKGLGIFSKGDNHNDNE